MSRSTRSARSPSPSSTRRRFARRQWSRRWATWRLVLAAVLLAALVAGGVWLVFFSSVFAVETVRVEGVRMLGAQRVEQVAGVRPGQPLARVDLDAIRDRIENVPAVEEAEVARTWPHTVTIAVTERTPVGVLRAGERFRLIDADGVLFRRVRSAPERLPLIQRQGGGKRAVAEAAAVLAAAPDDLLRRVRHVEAPTMDSVTLVLRGGRRVVWGSAEESPLKAEVLSALMEQQRGRVYDVSVPGSPTVSVS